MRPHLEGPSIVTLVAALVACGPFAAAARAARSRPGARCVGRRTGCGGDRSGARPGLRRDGSALGALPARDGVRRGELRGAVHIVRDIAGRGALTAERMPLAFLTLQRNVELWTTHGPPAAGSPAETDAGPALQAAVAALHDVAAATHDPTATALARDGLRAARRHIARFDTGRWSLYAEHGPLADLNYHVLNRDLVGTLCQRTNERAICNAWHSFTAELERRCPRVPGSSRGASRQVGRPAHRP